MNQEKNLKLDQENSNQLTNCTICVISLNGYVKWNLPKQTTLKFFQHLDKIVKMINVTLFYNQTLLQFNSLKKTQVLMLMNAGKLLNTF